MVFVTNITFLRYFVFVTVCLGVCVTFVCINMCTSMVFVIQLPFIQWSMLLWLLPSECLPFRMKLMTYNDLCGPTCLWLCSLCLRHIRRYLFRSWPGTFVKTRFHGVMSSNGLCEQHFFFCLIVGVLCAPSTIFCAIYSLRHLHHRLC